MLRNQNQRGTGRIAVSQNKTWIDSVFDVSVRWTTDALSLLMLLLLIVATGFVAVEFYDSLVNWHKGALRHVAIMFSRFSYSSRSCSCSATIRKCVSSPCRAGRCATCDHSPIRPPHRCACGSRIDGTAKDVTKKRSAQSEGGFGKLRKISATTASIAGPGFLRASSLTRPSATPCHTSWFSFASTRSMPSVPSR